MMPPGLTEKIMLRCQQEMTTSGKLEEWVGRREEAGKTLFKYGSIAAAFPSERAFQHFVNTQLPLLNLHLKAVEQVLLAKRVFSKEELDDVAHAVAHGRTIIDENSRDEVAHAMDEFTLTAEEELHFNHRIIEEEVHKFTTENGLHDPKLAEDEEDHGHPDQQGTSADSGPVAEEELQREHSRCC